MDKAAVVKWTGLTASLLAAMLSGIFLSFNVYAVQLKTQLGLTQTQVEILASFTIAGLCVVFIGYLIIEKWGYRVCYVTAWSMVTSSCLLMWIATLNPDFFRRRVAFLCVFQFISTVGGCFTELCCIAIAVTLFPERHVGKVTGIYLAAVSLGKIYYAFIYQVFFQTAENVGMFFLSIPAAFTVVIPLCVLFHKPSSGNSEERVEALETEEDTALSEVSHVTHTSERNTPGKPESTHISLNKILSSWFFHLFLWSNAFFNGCATSFMNNVTSIGHDIGMQNIESTVYAISAGIIISRVSCGVIYDCFHNTKVAGDGLLIFCYVTFIFAMVIGRFWLNELTIYIMIALASIGSGASFSLGLAVLVTEFGLHHYSFVLSLSEVGVTFSTFLIQVLTGLTHDHASGQRSSTASCNQCFDWTFVILFSGALLSLMLVCVTCIRHHSKSKSKG